MSYVGNPITIGNLTSQLLNGGSSSYTLNYSVGSNASISVFIDGVHQKPGTSYTVSATTLTFPGGATPSGTNNICVVFHSLPINLPTPGDGTITNAKVDNSAAIATSKISGAVTSIASHGLGTSATVDTGTSANQIVKLDGSAKIPAVDGSQLTNLPSDITKQGSDPTISTNPAGGVGTMILNTSSGKLFVCTDATAGANVWKAGEDGTIQPSYAVDYLVVAGGGGAGGSQSGYSAGGGGGAGGYRNTYNSETSGGGGSSETALTLTPSTQYTVTVGAGGTGGVAGSSAGVQGSNSVFSTITSTGGGKGGSAGAFGTNAAISGGGAGGSGGGGQGYHTLTAGAGTANQGYGGGVYYGNSGGNGMGAGGGAGAVGGNGTSTAGGTGGVGVASSITGSSVFRAGGGGAGATPSAGNDPGEGLGGNGGGGAGNQGVSSGSAGTANTGGGGGGGAAAYNGGNGGSGVVILRMPTANYSSTTTGSPTVTTSGSDTILTFTSSGSYTA